MLFRSRIGAVLPGTELLPSCQDQRAHQVQLEKCVPNEFSSRKRELDPETLSPIRLKRRNRQESLGSGRRTSIDSLGPAAQPLGHGNCDEQSASIEEVLNERGDTKEQQARDAGHKKVHCDD